MDETSAFVALGGAFAVFGGGWYLFAPLRGLFGPAPGRALPCCLRRATATEGRRLGRVVALGAAVTGCAGSGLPETLPADSPANPAAQAAPRPTVAQALRSADPLAWPPLAPAPAGGHHHHHGHHGAAAAPAASGHAGHGGAAGKEADSDHAGHSHGDHAGHGAPTAPSPASVPANDHSGHGAPPTQGGQSH